MQNYFHLDSLQKKLKDLEEENVVLRSEVKCAPCLCTLWRVVDPFALSDRRGCACSVIPEGDCRGATCVVLIASLMCWGAQMLPVGEGWVGLRTHGSSV